METTATESPSSLGDDLTGIISEYSMPHMAEMSSESLLTQSQYAKVIFHDIADAYSTDTDVCCRYSLTDGVTPCPGDRVCLYRVGWTSVEECILFEPVPGFDVADNKGQKEFEVMFKAGSLPKDANEFYQLCYVTAEGSVCGASVPFQFCRPQKEDLCLVEGPEGMAVVRSRSAVAEERLRKVERERSEAQRRVREVEEGYAAISKELQTASNKMGRLETEKLALEAKLSAMSHLDRLLSSLKQENEALDSEKNQACTRLREAEMKIEVLSENVKALTSEKDHVSGLLRAEARHSVDMFQYQSQAEGLQAMLEAMTQSKEMVAQELRAEQQLTAKLRSDMENARKESIDLNNQITALTVEKESLQYLLNQALTVKTSAGVTTPSGEDENLRREVEELRRDKERLLAQLTHAAGAELERARLRSLLDRNKECVDHQEELVLASREIAALQLKVKEKDSALEACKDRRGICKELFDDILGKKDININGAIEEIKNVFLKCMSELKGEFDEAKFTLLRDWVRSKPDGSLEDLQQLLSDECMSKLGQEYEKQRRDSRALEMSVFREQFDARKKLTEVKSKLSDAEKLLSEERVIFSMRINELEVALSDALQKGNKKDDIRIASNDNFFSDMGPKIGATAKVLHDVKLQSNVCDSALKSERQKEQLIAELELQLADEVKELKWPRTGDVVSSVLEEERQVFTVRINELERRLSQAKDKLGEEIALRETLIKAAATEEKKMFAKTITDLQRELADVKRMLAAEEALRESKVGVAIGEEREIFAKRINELEKEVAEHKFRLGEEKTIREGMVAVSVGDDRKIFAKRINELERNLAEANTTLKEERLRKNVEGKVFEDLARIEAEKVSLEGDLRDSVDAIMELEDRVMSVKTRLAEIEEECGRTETELQQVFTTLGAQRDELATLQEHIESQERRLRGELGCRAAEDSGFASDELRRAKSEVRNTEAFVESSMMRVSQLQDKIEELFEERRVLEQQLNQAQESKEQRETMRCALVKRLGEAEGAMTILMQEMGSGNNVGDQGAAMSGCSLEDLKCRLQLAAVEYQKLYQEKVKAERKLAKLLSRRPSASSLVATPPAEPATVQDLVTLAQDCCEPRNLPVFRHGASH